MEKIGKGISYNYNAIGDKHFFGGFFNLAMNNIINVIKEFKIRLKLENKENHTKLIDTYFCKEKSFTDWERGIKILKEYFPVIAYLDLPVTSDKFKDIEKNKKEEIRRKYFRDNLILLINTIDDLRNFYTHHYHQSIKIKKEVADFLDETLLKVCLDVKGEKMKTDKTKQILKSSLKNELDELIKLKKEELKEKKISGWNNTEKAEGAVYNNAFNHLIYKDKEARQSKLKDYCKTQIPTDKIDKIEGDLKVGYSIHSIVFLLSLFLSKRETEQLMSNLKGFKATVIGNDEQRIISKTDNSLKYMATHWVFTYLAYKGLKHRISSTFEKETLLMQMIDEINKVPDEVYQTLSEQMKKEFLEDINEYVQDNKENDKNLSESTIVHPVIRKRYEDKFNYFAVRFLDEFANFPSLKFDVYAGNFIHDKRSKKINDNSVNSERIIKEKINVFGKLSEVSKYKNDYFSGTEENETLNWELFPNPSYLFIGNNIPVFIDMIKRGKEAEECQEKIDQLKKDINPPKKRGLRQSKEEIIKIIYNNNKDIKYGDATALLSINELPALLYEFLVKGKTGEELENIIIDKIVKQVNIIKKYDKSSNLSNSIVTKNLKKSETDKEIINVKKLSAAIAKEIEITEEKLKMIERNREEFKQKKRKYVFYIKEKGQEATFLAYDIKRFMPEAAKKQWRGYHHSELQYLLAFYDNDKKAVIDLITQFWDFSKDNFFGQELKTAFKENIFENFYESYLKQRKTLLKSMQITFENNKEDAKLIKKATKDIFKFFNKRYYTIKSSEEQKNQLLTKPICLPRGIFDDKPTYIQGENVESNSALYAEWYQYTYSSEHQFQSFYDLKRDYKDLFEAHITNNKESITNKKNLNSKEQFDLFKLKQDLKIKKIKYQDLFIKLIINKIFKEVFKKDINLNLKDMYQTSKERYNNFLKANKQSTRQKGDDSKNILEENFIWNKTIAISLFNGRIFEPKVKIKDIGKFRKLESDSKVKSLLEYDTFKIWNKLEIENELENSPDSYERVRREKALKLIQEFEKFILENNKFDGINHPKQFEKDNHPNFRQYIIEGVLKKINGINTEVSANILIHLRNKFGHNQFPDLKEFELIKSLYNKNTDETYSAYFYRVCVEIIEEMKTNLN